MMFETAMMPPMKGFMTKVLVIYLTLVMMTMLSGCGLQNQINDLKDRSDRTETEVDDLQNRVTALEAAMRSNGDQLNALSYALSAQGAALTAQVANITSQVAALTAAGSATSQQVSDLQAALTQANNDLATLTGRVTAVEGDTVAANMAINAVSTSVADLLAYVNLLAQAGVDQFILVDNALHNLEVNASAVNQTLGGIQYSITALQTASSATLVQIATLQGYKNIVSIKDPCGAQGNVQNEVFLKLSDGKYLASFSENENGKNTRFSLLTDGTYKTTDSTNCQFTVSGGGTVISNEHN